MNQIKQTNRKRGALPRIFAAALITVFAIPMSGAMAHEWTIDKQKTKATVRAFDGQTVTFELPNRKMKSVSVQQLNKNDLGYLKTLVELSSYNRDRSSDTRDRAIQMAQLQVMLEQYRSQWYELWVVQFVGPGGQYFYWAYPVRNSYQAMVRAQYQFPQARILWVRKLRRQF